MLMAFIRADMMVKQSRLRAASVFFSQICDFQIYSQQVPPFLGVQSFQGFLGDPEKLTLVSN